VVLLGAAARRTGWELSRLPRRNDGSQDERAARCGCNMLQRAAGAGWILPRRHENGSATLLRLWTCASMRPNERGPAQRLAAAGGREEVRRPMSGSELHPLPYAFGGRTSEPVARLAQASGCAGWLLLYEQSPCGLGRGRELRTPILQLMPLRSRSLALCRSPRALCAA